MPSSQVVGTLGRSAKAVGTLGDEGDSVLPTGSRVFASCGAYNLDLDPPFRVTCRRHPRSGMTRAPREQGLLPAWIDVST